MLKLKDPLYRSMVSQIRAENQDVHPDLKQRLLLRIHFGRFLGYRRIGMIPTPTIVLSADHGHLHDAPGSKSLTPKILGKNEINKITVPKQDKNNPPEGKVWNEEHGHFHNKE